MTRTRQGVCLAVGMLCALGILSAIAVRSEATPHHRLPAIAASAGLADGHGASSHVNPYVDLPGHASIAGSPRLPAAVAASVTDSTSAPVLTVRTRGPPATAA